MDPLEVPIGLDPVDLSSSTVLNSILSDLNNAISSSSSSRPRYEIRMWERTIPFHSKKTNSTQTVKARRPYIFDTLTNMVITVQNKAWMDSVGLLMWLDTQLGPYTVHPGFILYRYNHVRYCTELNRYQ